MASIAAIVAELAAARTTGVSFPFSVALTVATLALSWTFTHLIFALHYANLYYRSDRNGGHGGLAFPGEREPDYRDFLYYSFVIATSAQTADVATVSPAMRRTTLVHCIVAFVFNSAILALMIGAAGLALFAATGVTSGDLLESVRFFGGGARTHSLVMAYQTKTVRFVDTVARGQAADLEQQRARGASGSAARTR